MDASRAIRALYKNADGFEIPRAEERAVTRSGGDPLYGELTPSGTSRLLGALAMGPRDVFYDLGSGVGKVVLQVAMTTSVRRCIGYELSETRCRLARSRLLSARRQGLISARRCAFYSRDILTAPVDDATVVYACSTAFSDRFMRRLMRRLTSLPAPLTFVSLRVLDEHRRFELIERLSVRTTWDRRSPAYIYKVRPR